MPLEPYDSQADITAVLRAWGSGDSAALERLIDIVYGELRSLAQAHLRHEQNESLQPTALIHEAYLKLAALDRATIENRVHFFALAARLMRQVLVDQARRRKAAKRGRDLTIVGLDDVAPLAHLNYLDVLSLHAALDEMGNFDPRQRDVVELRYFAGLTIAETAAALNVSVATVERDWMVARAWLYRRLGARS